MVSIFYLEKFGLSHLIAERLCGNNFCLLDCFQLHFNHNERISQSTGLKVQNALINSLKGMKDCEDIFDDIIMLSSVGAKINQSRIYQMVDSISSFKEQYWITDWKSLGLEAASKKAVLMIGSYMKLLASSKDEVEDWACFVSFLRCPIQLKESVTFSPEVISRLISRNLLNQTSSGLEYYLNLDEIEVSDDVCKIFQIKESLKDTIKCFSIEKNKMHLQEYLLQNFKDNELFELRLSGLTLQEIGDRYGLTRERVRQRLNKVISQLPKLIELEQFRNIFCQFFISKNLFVEIFHKDGRVYELLSLVYSKGEGDIEKEILEGDYSQEAKEYILNKNQQILLDSRIMELNRETMLTDLLRQYKDFQEYFTVEEMYYLYSEAIDTDYPNLTVNSARNLGCLAERYKHIILSSGHGFRFYEPVITSDIKKRLQNFICKLKPGAYNMNYVYSKYQKVFETLDIRDGSELHNIFKMYNISFEGFNLRRNPEFTIGVRSKKDFLLEKIKQNSGRNIDEFVSILHEEYGFHPGSVRSYLLTHFSKYIGQSCVQYDQNDYSTYIDLLGNVFQKYLYFEDEFSNIIFEHTDLTTVTPLLVTELGFVNKGMFIIRSCFSSTREAIKAYILQNNYFTFEYNKFTRTSDFYDALYELERNIDIIKIAPNQYRNISKNLEFKKKCKELIHKFETLIEEEEFFTLHSILKSGRFDLTNYQWISEVSLDRLLWISTHFQLIRSGYPTLYYNGKYKKNLNDFYYSLLIKNGSCNLNYFVGYLKDEYGLQAKTAEVKRKLLDAGAIFHTQSKIITISEN
ncbi:TPA: sigma factor-like helix-turn-helix DNA-binding protein [Streptococcus suis]